MRAWMGLLLAIVAVVAASQGVLRPSSPLSARRRLLETSADYPSLKIHVTFKRKNANFHGHSEFDVYASPVLSADGISLRYDGYATFVEDKTQFTYSLVGGASYLTTKSDTERVQCLPSGALSFDSALPALNAAVSVPSASIGIESVQCARGSLYKTSYGDATFAVCASGASGFTASGLDLSIEVEYLPDAVSIPTPKLPDGSSSCDAVAMPTEVTPTSRAILTGGTLPPVSSRILKASAPMAIEAESCMCKSSPRPCVFLHGLGTSNEKTELQNTPKLTQEKFGDIGNHAPCCTTVKYAVINTVDAGWRNDTLQQKFCDFSLSMSDSSDVTTGTIADTIVVTHSMGGLVMAAALAKGKCKFAESTSWVSLSAPMMGSMAGDFIQDLCDGDYTSIVSGLLDLLGQCPASTAKKSIVYQNEKYSTPKINAAYIAAQEAYRGNVTAAICSTSYHGVLSKFTPSCLVGGKLIPHKSKENDALVEFHSCLGGLDPDLFGDSYRDRFYAAKLNHADTAFLTHDGFFKNSQKPFKWFECLL